jgi:hypothetical protein
VWPAGEGEHIPASLIKEILDRARALQEQLTKSGEVTPALKRRRKPNPGIATNR